MNKNFCTLINVNKRISLSVLFTVLLYHFSCSPTDNDAIEQFTSFEIEEVYSVSQHRAFVHFSSAENAMYSLVLFPLEDLANPIDSLTEISPSVPILLCGLAPNTSYVIKLYAFTDEVISTPKTEEFITDSVGTDNTTDVVEVTNPITGKIWMDRNLGADRVAQTSNDNRAYGHLYQWGRRADGHQYRDSPSTEEIATKVQPDHGAFIIGQAYWHNTQKTDMWDGWDAINNPCPCGFRLPTHQELTEELATWSSADAQGALESTLRMPLAGYRGNAVGNVGSENLIGYYWSSEASGMNGLDLGINYTNANPTGHNQAGGASIRCIKD